MKVKGLIMRQASASDEPLLREMLYHSLYVPEGGPQFDRAVVRQPEIAKYVDGWGRPGDLGLIAVDSGSGEPVGAAWIRLFAASQKGYGYVGDHIPELGIAVLPEFRNCGIGSALLHRLLEMAASVHDAVSLSVSSDNPALRLYERLGFERVATMGNSVTMLKRMASPTA